MGWASHKTTRLAVSHPIIQKGGKSIARERMFDVQSKMNFPCGISAFFMVAQSKKHSVDEAFSKVENAKKQATVEKISATAARDVVAFADDNAPIALNPIQG